MKNTGKGCIFAASGNLHTIKAMDLPAGRMRAVFIVNGWKHTAPQAKAGEWIDNQEYLRNAVKHNIEDAIQLADIIYGKEKFCRFTIDKISENI